ncbi:MAG: sensor histidine kinase [Lachnospiraceae bacterium]|nr:sensor histidine kinase [Lachnospiraceae bacterium]
MLILSCLFNILAYILAQYLFFDKKVKEPIAYVIGLVIYSAISFIPALSVEEKHLLIYVVTTVCCFFSFRGKWKTRIIPVFILFFIISAVYGIALSVCNLLIARFIPQNLTGLYNISREILCVGFISLGLLIKKLIKTDRRKKLLKIADKYLIFTTLFTAMIIALTISLLEYSGNIISDVKYQNIVTIVSGIAYISLGFLGGMTLYVKQVNEEMRTLMNNEVMIKDMQKKYYEALLDQEKGTRAYRHDMANHIMCLNALAEKGDLETLRSYLNDMQGELQKIQGRKYKTGNEILDIMSNFYLPQLSDKIKVNFRVKSVPKLDEMSLCTIYSNLLQNAVEELNSSPEREGNLDIIFSQDIDVCRLMISNSIFREKEENSLKTHKKDKKNHGIGLSNVKKVVDDLGGKIWITDKDNIFKVIVELKSQ